jgi:hypothetical protein
MGASLRQYLGFAVNAAAVTGVNPLLAWSEALDTAPRVHQLNLSISERPRLWHPVQDPTFSMTLMACSDSIGSADVHITDGVNRITVALSRPMWARGPAATVAVSAPGAFARKLETELGLVCGGHEIMPLGVDVDATELKFLAANVCTGHRLRDADDMAMRCGQTHSASASAECVALVRVYANGSYAVSRAVEFPKDLITTDLVECALGYTSSESLQTDALTVQCFPCTKGEAILMVCARAMF